MGIDQPTVYGSLSPALTCYRQILGVKIYTTEEIIGRKVTKSIAPSRFFCVSPVHSVCRHNIGDHSFWTLCLVLMLRWAPGSFSVGRKLICSGPHPGPCIMFCLSSLWRDPLGSVLNVFQGQTKLEPFVRLLCFEATIPLTPSAPLDQRQQRWLWNHRQKQNKIKKCNGLGFLFYFLGFWA